MLNHCTQEQLDAVTALYRKLRKLYTYNHSTDYRNITVSLRFGDGKYLNRCDVEELFEEVFANGL